MEKELIESVIEKSNKLHNKIKGLIFNEERGTYCDGGIPINAEDYIRVKEDFSYVIYLLENACGNLEPEKAESHNTLTPFLMAMIMMSEIESLLHSSELMIKIDDLKKSFETNKLERDFYNDMHEINSKLIKKLSKPAILYGKFLSGSKAGIDKRYEKNRELYIKALEIAKMKWEDGSKFKHDKMRDWLIDDYDENGKPPFYDISRESLKEKLKKMLYEMNRCDLIRGYLPQD